VPNSNAVLGYDPNAGPAAVSAGPDKGVDPNYWADVFGSKSNQPTPVDVTSNAFQSPANQYATFQAGPQDTSGPSASALAEQARARLAELMGDPKTAAETTKAVEATNAPESMRDFVSPEQGYSKFQQPGKAPLSDLSNLPPEFPDFTKLYPEYRGGAPASAAEPTTDAARPADKTDTSMAGRKEALDTLKKELEATGLAMTSSYRSEDDPLSIKNPNSAHTKALAFDTRAQTPAQADTAMAGIRELMNARGLVEGKDYKVLDEVRNPSAWATGPHVHTQMTEQGMQKYQESAYDVNAGQVIPRPPADIPSQGPLPPEAPAALPPDMPRPSADVFPEARLAPNGQEPELFVVHHTSGGGTPESVVEGWRTDPDPKRKGVGAQYIMDRNGVVHDTANEFGYTGYYQAKDLNVPGTGVSKTQGTGNSSIVGMEIIARNEKDVTPAQQAALVRFANERYPNVPFYGHGEISGNRMNNEGIPGAQAVLASRPAPFNFDWSNAPIPGPANARPMPAPTSSYGPLATQDAPAAGVPTEAVPLPTARPAAANIAQANSVLDSKVLDLVRQNSPANVDRIPSSIANQTLREALGNTMTGGMIRSGLTPYLPQMGVSAAEFDKAYAGGQAQPPRAAGGIPEDDSWTPQEYTPKWNTDVYQPALGGGVQHRDETASDLRWSDFARPGNVEDRTGEQLSRAQLAALQARGTSYPAGPEVASSPLGAALGLGDLPAPRGMAAANVRPPGAVGSGGDENPDFNFDSIWPPQEPDNTTGMRDFVSPEQGYGNFQQPASRDALAKTMDFSGFSPSPEPRQGGVGPEVTLSPEHMQTMAEVESHNNPALHDPGSQYKGLYQLNDTEFRKYGGTGDIYDYEQNYGAAGRKMIAEGQRAQDILGRELSPVEQYMVHQQGLAGTLAHLANPDELAWKNFQSASGRSDAGAKKAIWDNLSNDMKAQFGNDVNNITSRDFINLWNEQYADKAVAAGLPRPGTGGYFSASP
jgi:hypothetical protein